MLRSEAITNGMRNGTISSSVYYKIWAYFHKNGIDVKVLQICIPMVSLLILITNGVLLQRLLLKKTKTRPDKLFVLLSLIWVSEHFQYHHYQSFTNLDVLCKVFTISRLFHYFPYVVAMIYGYYNCN